MNTSSKARKYSQLARHIKVRWNYSKLEHALVANGSGKREREREILEKAWQYFRTDRASRRGNDLMLCLAMTRWLAPLEEKTMTVIWKKSSKISVFVALIT